MAGFSGPNRKKRVHVVWSLLAWPVQYFAFSLDAAVALIARPKLRSFLLAACALGGWLPSMIEPMFSDNTAQLCVPWLVIASPRALSRV